MPDSTATQFDRAGTPSLWTEIDELRERNRKLVEAAAFNPPGIDRLITAAERIATAIEAIAQHLAPVITGTPAPDPDRPLRVGDRVVDITSSIGNRGRIATMLTAYTATIHWDGDEIPGLTPWSLADFRRVQRMTAATPMTNDAGRVSDIVARLRRDSRSVRLGLIADREHYANGMAAAADIIEAQSKALAEAREALKPFADAADSLDIVADERAVIWGSDPLIQVRHFRAARRAYSLKTRGA